ncbi:MAG TPA: hypothetical protein GXZ49_05165 [Bacteroidetes bacterium]|nr:hypothetical protein [Bacteroidota bacterium]
MKENLKSQIKELLSLLTSEQLKKDILELENIPENQNVIKFLDKIGVVEIKYEIKSNFRPGRIQEKGGCTNLWYKKPDGTWMIKLWEINRLEK